MKSIIGTVRDGVIVLDQPLDIPEGTQVIVQVPPPDWLREVAGAWKHDRGIDEWLHERQQTRTMSDGPTL